jgi:arylsulfatase A-like enzyme
LRRASQGEEPARTGKEPAAQLHGAAGQPHRDPEELYATAFLGDRACAYLDEADDEAPFFLMVSFPDPHHPFNPPGKYWDMYKPEQFPVPRRSAQRLDAAGARSNIIKDREAGKANLTGMGTIGVSAREAQEARALTCGMIACIDDAIGAVLGALDKSGKRDDTVVIFTSDHGDHLGDHRLLLKGAEQYQSIVRVPFIWSDPQRRRSLAHRCARLDPGHRLDRVGARQDRAGERRPGQEPTAGAERRRGAGCGVHPVRPPGVEPGTGIPARVHSPDRRTLPA